jgi:hypothetical protein
MLDISLGCSSQLVASSLWRVAWQWKSAGKLNGRRLERVEGCSLGSSGWMGHTRTTHWTRLLGSESFIIESCGLVECCSLAAGQFER